MTQLSVMELAKQGDPNAIAALINKSLSSKGIHAEAELDGDCLKISLKAAQIPNQKAVVTIIHRGMMVLQIEQIKYVKIFTYRADNNYLAWQHELTLVDDFKQQSLVSEQVASNVKDVVQEQKSSLVNNQKGIILVQKLSQLQQNLQEYQDVIVRFTDEHVGTVRCLTTLTELIQVISKPSFLFASIAANPNLRSLLDTIAESSKTDENGDQVITNLSILQPGHQWQKAKIRLVSKIFLEPAEEQDEEIKTKHQGITLDLTEAVSQTVMSSNLDVLESDVPPDLDKGFKSDDVAKLDWEKVTPDSLSDDFAESGLPAPRIVNDITEDPDLSDSLFDEFMDDGASAREVESGYVDDEFLSVQSDVQKSVSQVEAIDGDGDLFDDFAFDSRANIPESASKESDIDTIKSRIPKQNLEELLMLMDQEDQAKSNSISFNKKNNVVNPLDPDIGATTLEDILASMDTISLKPSVVSSLPDFVTLDDFSDDLEAF